MLKAGDRLDRYTVESVLGEGGMGTVYRAHDERLDRHVALKVVRRDDTGDPGADAIARLVREARAAAKLDHPNAVSIFDLGAADGIAFIAMELVSGKNLRALVGDRSVALAERLRWLVDAGRALSAAHRAGLVHRDVKPENVMVRSDGMVKVLDFGIARRSAAPIDPSAPTEKGALMTLTAAGVPVGTPLYMAPEQIRGEPVDGRTDQFAWGVLAYELLTGSVPWSPKHEPLALAAAIVTETPRDISKSHPDVPEEIDRIVAKALSKAPADRFGSMDDLVAALEPHAAGGAVSSPPGRRTSDRAPPQPRPEAAASPPGLRRYSTETMRAIMARALERQEQQGRRYTTEEIVEGAREIGVDEATLRAAMLDLELRNAEALDHAADRRRERTKLFRHAGIWAVVNLCCILMAGWGWTRWMLFGWGIGVAVQAVKYVFPEDAKEKREREAKKARKRGKGAPALPAPSEAEVREGVAALLAVTATRAGRVRVAAPRPRVRLDGLDSAGADEGDEAAEAEQADRVRRVN